MAPAAIPALQVRGLRTCFHSDDGIGLAVDDVSFDLWRGQTLGLVGESGCGKSVTALSIMGLVADPPGRIEAGQILYGARDLLQASEAEMRQVRGQDIAMVFQEPTTSLNPVLTCGQQIAEAIHLHQGVSPSRARERAVDMLRQVRIPAPEQRSREYPHQLSGGMCQRVMMAMALSCHPGVLIADEPTTALDVTVQAQILALLDQLRVELEMAVLLITHDLGVVAQVADRVAVMYAGQIVELAEAHDLFDKPAHPYTQGLLRSAPRPDTPPSDRLAVIPGTVPQAHSTPSGCRFSPRCPLANAACAAPPQLEMLGDGHQVRCWQARSDRPALAHPA